ncbi:YqxA family protein [Niallia sp. XMNu-256]|uniref:YqxA family protein n=1 Tax=Niallia sp. XMNu-256 TaxID=3082444 RepID=UPI0030CEE275
MKMFMLKSFLLACLMFVSVLFGMQQANEGIVRMKGYGHEQFQGAFKIQQKEAGEMEASILGNEISSHDIEKKKAKLEEMKAYNFFSSIGKSLASLISTITDSMIQLIADLLAK